MILPILSLLSIFASVSMSMIPRSQRWQMRQLQLQSNSKQRKKKKKKKKKNVLAVARGSCRMFDDSWTRKLTVRTSARWLWLIVSCSSNKPVWDDTCDDVTRQGTAWKNGYILFGLTRTEGTNTRRITRYHQRFPQRHHWYCYRRPRTTIIIIIIILMLIVQLKVIIKQLGSSWQIVSTNCYGQVPISKNYPLVFCWHPVVVIWMPWYWSWNRLPNGITVTILLRNIIRVRNRWNRGRNRKGRRTSIVVTLTIFSMALLIIQMLWIARVCSHPCTLPVFSTMVPWPLCWSTTVPTSTVCTHGDANGETPMVIFQWIIVSSRRFHPTQRQR